ncbi:MAG: zf-HC2 domain-containing protein [Vicinamibacteria bacterium]
MTKITCDEAARQFFAHLDRALAGEALEALEAHLEACLDCCDKLDFSRKVDSFVKQRLGDQALPDDLEARIRRLTNV